jgi:hypothetical protein
MLVALSSSLVVFDRRDGNIPIDAPFVPRCEMGLGVGEGNSLEVCRDTILFNNYEGEIIYQLRPDAKK